MVRPVEEFHWGTTTWVDSIEQNLGGNGSNTSYTLGMLGVPVRLLGMVGRDAFGELAISILKSANVDLSAVGRSQAPTTASVCPVSAAGDRLFMHRVGSSAEVFPEPIEFTPQLLEGMSHFHLANVFALPQLRLRAPESLARARKAGLTTSLDTGWDARGRWLEDIEGCLPHLDLFFMNQDEARMLSGSPDPEQAARRMQALGARDVVIKLGAEGGGRGRHHRRGRLLRRRLSVCAEPGRLLSRGGPLRHCGRGAQRAETGRDQWRPHTC